jgi:glyoxylase I family protein
VNDGPTHPGFRHLAFKVDDVDKKLASMTNVEITLGPLDFDDFIPGWRTVWIRDPDGRIVEISQGFTDEA